MDSGRPPDGRPFYSSPFALRPSALLLLYFARRAKCRAARNHCVIRNYNLTGNTTGICPECGDAIAPGVSVVHD